VPATVLTYAVISTPAQPLVVKTTVAKFVSRAVIVTSSLSPAVTRAGKPGSSAALEESPLENMSGITTNQRAGSRTPSGPISQARSSWVAV